MSILGFEVFTSRLLGVVVASVSAVMAIAIAMLGLGAAASLSALFPTISDANKRDRLHQRLLFLLVGFYLISFFAITVKSNANALQFYEALSAAGEAGLISTILSSYKSDFLVVGSIFTLPYVVFGYWVADFFRNLPSDQYHKFYGADLVGAAIGCVVVVLALDKLGFSGALLFVVFSGLLGAVLLRQEKLSATRLLGAGVLGAFSLVIVTTDAIQLIEPRPSLERLSRNFSLSRTAFEEWSVWNSQSRVARIRIETPESAQPSWVYAHQNGEGWAIVPEINQGEVVVGNSSERLSALAAMFDPKDVLVLFAGVGQDMVEIDDACERKCGITGVEINRQMVEHALEEDPPLADFHARSNINLVVAEGREFLERSRKKYDAILLSWWGAGTSHSVGTAAMLAEYLYTKQSFDQIIQLLNEDGMVIIFNGSKLQVIATLRAAMIERGKSNFREMFIVGGKENLVYRERSTDDNLRLFFKPSGFTPQEEVSILSEMKKRGMVSVLSPTTADDSFSFLTRLAGGEPLDSINENLRKLAGAELSVITDNWPFLHNIIPVKKRFNPFAWGANSDATGAEQLFRLSVSMTFVLACAALLVAIVPLYWTGGPERNWPNAIRLTYFTCIGLGFMLVEIGFVRKFGLVLGHPSLSIAVVLAALILSTGLGSLASNFGALRSQMSERLIALAIVAYTCLLLAIFDSIGPTITAMSQAAKGTIVIALLLPMGFLMGQLMPRGLENSGETDPKLIPWAWGINAAASTIGVAISYSASFIAGINELIIVGLLFYFALPKLPMTTKTA